MIVSGLINYIPVLGVHYVIVSGFITTYLDTHVLGVHCVIFSGLINGQLEKQGAGNGTGTGTGVGAGAGAGPERYRITSLIRAIKWV